MNTSTTTPVQTAARDQDLAAQAHPGHGVPSQDPDPAAQTAIEPEEAEREAKSALTGGGAVGGAAIGASIGGAVGGPVGVVVGGTPGAVAGALGGAAAGGGTKPGDPGSAEPEDDAPAPSAPVDSAGGVAKP